MSLVGTRPILQDELQKYELHHRARIAIKPGITGMWQVSGRSDIWCKMRKINENYVYKEPEEITIQRNKIHKNQRNIEDFIELIEENSQH